MCSMFGRMGQLNSAIAPHLGYDQTNKKSSVSYCPIIAKCVGCAVTVSQYTAPILP